MKKCNDDKHNGNEQQRKYICTLLSHPAVADRIARDGGILDGLSGTTRLDYLVGVVEEAYKQAHNEDRLDGVLKIGYELLRRDFPLCFSTAAKKSVRRREDKNPCYKACNGF